MGSIRLVGLVIAARFVVVLVVELIVIVASGCLVPPDAARAVPFS